ncbi:hypothetical protein Ctha_1902 [Chloroherpeton thalassium ATCC 35110]|uniref:Tetratricopeptide TPR_2 repeat protein n=1 Tax=Chloroherpeton thalassium (strain ATCC 35110 / GB-78) TaxID=517418 RepID=B3QUA7_CHLT3|nr:hypothetical protein [Chloroherpeton thalassium]ACF14356.1 hypothetical protein Ctha_1902 [Chloroherpeton thalassium ATCC 35110]
MKFFLTIFLLIFSLEAAFAQQAPSFVETDKATYQAYVKGEWGKVICLGTAAIERGTDYFYLRMRIAYAYFMKAQYRKAAGHYEHALALNEGDPIALEYLYYSYLYAGRAADARCLSGRFPESLKKSMKLNDKSEVVSAGLNITYASGSNDELKNEILATAPTEQDGFQSLPVSWVNYQATLAHRLGDHVLLGHSVSLLYKDIYSVDAADGAATLSDARTIRQFNYNLSANMTFSEGFTFAPLISYINYSVPVASDSATGVGQGRQSAQSMSFSEHSFGLRASLELGLFRASLAGARSNFFEGEQTLGALALSVFPSGNLNLYYTASAYLNRQSKDGASESQFVHKHEIGLKVAEHLWLEVLAMQGDFTNLYDPFSEISYNSPERYRTIAGLTLVVPFFEVGITGFLGYRYIRSESIFIPYENASDITNRTPFNFQSITGGITWTF